MRILAIETSCDETAMALVEAHTLTSSQDVNFEVLADAVSSQIAVHRPFGGVVPHVAKREHLLNLPIVYRKIKKKLEIRSAGRRTKSEIDRIAVTIGPGLEPALWTGINFAKELGKQLKVKVVGVNHLEGHIYSNWLPPVRKFPISNPEKSHGDLEVPLRDFQNPKFPAVCLIVSGGHTILLLMKSMTQWKKLGETRDDAVGEAFDKVAKMLGLPYPGGPEVEYLAAAAAKYSILGKGRLSRPKSKDLINFPRPMIHQKNYDFSFSGLKTAVLYYLRDIEADQRARPAILKEQSGGTTPAVAKALAGKRGLTQKMRTEICASFQKAAIDVLVSKTIQAAQALKAKSILLCGGVATNKALRKAFESRIMNQELRKMKLFVPPLKYNTDNAVMIAAAAYLSPKKYPIEARPNLNL